MRRLALALAISAILVWLAASRPIAQDAEYHHFADARVLLGIPNCLNVMSNVPFALVGAWGITLLLNGKSRRALAFNDQWEQWPYLVLFAGTLLTAFGSSYYHLSPNTPRLVWDRLPMAPAFMGLLTAMIAERVGLQMARRVFIPFVVLGIASVVYWAWSERQGWGDLRPYGIVQFGSLLGVVVLLVLYRGRYGGNGCLAVALAFYLLAKLLELADWQVYAWGHLVSGHALKHVAAAGGVASIAAMLQMRKRMSPSSPVIKSAS